MEKSITIIEPSILFYEGLTTVLERNSSYKVIYTSDEFIHSKVKLGDILMMDINIFMKWKDLIFGLTLQRSIKIITFANENEAELVIEAIKEGVDAFLLREIDSNEIYNCIEFVMADKMYVHGRATDYLIEKSCLDRKSTRLNSSHVAISYAVFCLKKKHQNHSKNHLTYHVYP